MIADHQNEPQQFLRVVHSARQEREIQNAVFKKRFLVKSGEMLVPLSIEQIAYFCSFDKWTYLVVKQGKQYLIDTNLRTLEEQLNPELFFRLNRRYLVKLESIKSLVPCFKGQVSVNLIPQPDERIVVSRKKTAELKHWIAD